MANGLFNLKQVVQAVQQGGWPAQKTPAVEYLVVAGGGGSGYNWGSPGGAGGLLTGLDPVPNGQTLLVTVGGGGTSWSNGSNSVFGSIISTGGGAGGGGSTVAYSGGSGGGASVGAGGNGLGFGLGIVGQGNDGGKGWTGGGGATANASGGGGGAGTRGADVFVAGYGALGGSGVSSAITGTATNYAGGGNGNGNYGANSDTTGGRTASGTAGTANTGSGAGAGDYNAGGSGIVIVSYPDVYAAPTATTGSPTVSTSGSGSVSFSGSSQYLVSGTSSNFSLGTSDFSVECWVYKTSSVSDQAAVASSVTGNLDPLFFYFSNGSNNALLYLSSNGSTFDIASAVAVGTVSLNTWAHLAVTRVGSTFTTYLNGAQTSTFTSSASIYKSVNTFAIAAGQTSINGFKGYISNVRVLKGSSAYSGAFTPSTTPLTPITNTVLLVNTVSGAPFVDSSTTSTTFTATGSPAWNALSPFTVTGYKNRVYRWTSSGSITF
jgi:hypothetical protein